MVPCVQNSGYTINGAYTIDTVRAISDWKKRRRRNYAWAAAAGADTSGAGTAGTVIPETFSCFGTEDVSTSIWLRINWPKI